MVDDPWAEPLPEPETSSRRWAWLWAVGALVAALCLGALYLHRSAERVDQRATDLEEWTELADSSLANLEELRVWALSGSSDPSDRPTITGWPTDLGLLWTDFTSEADEVRDASLLWTAGAAGAVDQDGRVTDVAMARRLIAGPLYSNLLDSAYDARRSLDDAMADGHRSAERRRTLSLACLIGALAAVAIALVVSILSIVRARRDDGWPRRCSDDYAG